MVFWMIQLEMMEQAVFQGVPEWTEIPIHAGVADPIQNDIIEWLFETCGEGHFSLKMVGDQPDYDYAFTYFIQDQDLAILFKLTYG